MESRNVLNVGKKAMKWEQEHEGEGCDCLSTRIDECESTRKEGFDGIRSTRQLAQAT